MYQGIKVTKSYTVAIPRSSPISKLIQSPMICKNRVGEKLHLSNSLQNSCSGFLPEKSRIKAKYPDKKQTHTNTICQRTIASSEEKYPVRRKNKQVSLNQTSTWNWMIFWRYKFDFYLVVRSLELWSQRYKTKDGPTVKLQDSAGKMGGAKQPVQIGAITTRKRCTYSLPKFWA